MTQPPSFSAIQKRQPRGTQIGEFLTDEQDEHGRQTRFRSVSGLCQTAGGCIKSQPQAKLMKALVSIVSLFVLGGGLVRAGVEVSAVRIEDTRTQVFHDDNVSRGQAELKLTLALAGPEAEAAAQYGNVQIDEAVDDTGASLLPKKDSLSDTAKFKEYDNAFFRKNRFGNREPAAPQFEVRLATPKRAATKIARLRGSLSLSGGGTVQAIELPSLKGADKKAVAIPAAANVTVTVSAKAQDTRSIDYEISGDESAIESMEVLDASGQKVSNGTSTFSFGNGPAHHSIDLERPLDDSMKLVVKITLDRKITKVDFDLKDIPLP